MIKQIIGEKEREGKYYKKEGLSDSNLSFYSLN